MASKEHNPKSYFIHSKKQTYMSQNQNANKHNNNNIKQKDNMKISNTITVFTPTVFGITACELSRDSVNQWLRNNK